MIRSSIGRRGDPAIVPGRVVADRRPANKRLIIAAWRFIYFDSELTADECEQCNPPNPDDENIIAYYFEIQIMGQIKKYLKILIPILTLYLPAELL